MLDQKSLNRSSLQAANVLSHINDIIQLAAFAGALLYGVGYFMLWLGTAILTGVFNPLFALLAALPLLYACYRFIVLAKVLSKVRL